MVPRRTTGRGKGAALVLGAGAVGLSCAYFLRRSGREVRVVDAGLAGHGATKGTAGLVCPAHSAPLPGPGVLWKALRWSLRRDSPFRIRWRADPELLRWLLGFVRACNRARSRSGFRAIHALSSLSLARFAELAGPRGLDFFFERRGGWFVFETPDGFARARTEAEELRREGVECSALDGDAIREREPGLSDRVAGGVFAPHDAHGLSVGFAESLARALERDGVVIESGVRVERLLLDGSRVVGARTRAGAELAADETVLALGARSPEIARTAGVRIMVQPAKGYSATFRAYAGMPRTPVSALDSKVIVTPLGDRVRFAGTLELTGHEPGVNALRYRQVVRSGLAVLREPVPLEDEEAWSGMRPLTPDSLPIIGRPRGLDGLLVAAGHGTLGFAQSLGTGQLVAEMADGADPSVDPHPFRVDR